MMSLQTSPTTDWQMGKSVNECLGEMFDKKLWTDVSFRCKDQNITDSSDRISAHKIVLAARSPVFQAMFYGACADTSAEIVMSDTDSKVFKLFLKYMYSDNITLTEETVPAVMQIAHKYQVTNLLSFCSTYLASIIRLDNSCAILELALFFDEKKLKQGAVNFIDDNGEKVLMTDGFYELQLPALEYLFKGDTFLANEKYIFNAAMRWAKKQCTTKGLAHSGENLRKVLGYAFNLLRLPAMSAEDFSKLTYRKGYMKFEEMEDTLSYITGNKSIKPFCLVRPRRKRMGNCRPKHKEIYRHGRIEFGHYVNVTTKIRIRNKDLIRLTGVTMSSMIKSPIVADYINPKTKYNIHISFLKTMDNETDLLYPKIYFSGVKTARIQTLEFDPVITLKFTSDIFIMVHLMSYPNAMVYIPCLKETPPFDRDDLVLDQEVFNARLQPEQEQVGLQVIECTYMDNYRIVDNIRYESPSNR